MTPSKAAGVIAFCVIAWAFAHIFPLELALVMGGDWAVYFELLAAVGLVTANVHVRNALGRLAPAALDGVIFDNQPEKAAARVHRKFSNVSPPQSAKLVTEPTYGNPTRASVEPSGRVSHRLPAAPSRRRCPSRPRARGTFREAQPLLGLHATHFMRHTMSQNRVEGAGKKAAGAIKQAAGKATGNTKLQAKGATEKAAGTVQNKVGKAQDKM